jgi:hypothetical protein
MTIGPNLDFNLVQDSQPFVETSVGITLPLVPFNNYVYVTFESSATVNTSFFSGEALVVDNSATTRYDMTARVYLR